MSSAKYLRMQKKRRVATLKLLVFFILLYCCYSLTFSLARYLSTGSFDSIFSVAKWDVSVNNTLSNHSLNLLCGGSGETYQFSVTSESEVTTKYHVILSDVPNDVEVSLDGGSYTTPTNHTITFSDVGIFNIQDAQREHTHTLTFKAPVDASSVGTNDIEMKVSFSQVI